MFLFLFGSFWVFVGLRKPLGAWGAQVTVLPFSRAFLDVMYKSPHEFDTPEDPGQDRGVSALCVRLCIFYI